MSASNLLPKLTSFRDRAVRIMAPAKDAAKVTKEEMADLKKEFWSAFKDEMDAEDREIQWAGLVLRSKQHFIDADKLDKDRCKILAAGQYEIFSE